MNFINSKKQADHSGDYNQTNNGGITIMSPKGSTPAQSVGDKFSETPGSGQSKGINRAVVDANVD